MDIGLTKIAELPPAFLPQRRHLRHNGCRLGPGHRGRRRPSRSPGRHLSGDPRLRGPYRGEGSRRVMTCRGLAPGNVAIPQASASKLQTAGAVDRPEHCLGSQSANSRFNSSKYLFAQ